MSQIHTGVHGVSMVLKPSSSPEGPCLAWISYPAELGYGRHPGNDIAHTSAVLQTCVGVHFGLEEAGLSVWFIPLNGLSRARWKATNIGVFTIYTLVIVVRADLMDADAATEASDLIQ